MRFYDFHTGETFAGELQRPMIKAFAQHVHSRASDVAITDVDITREHRSWGR